MKKLLSLILAITLTLTLFASCGKAEKALTSAELLDLGEKYLLDLDYEQAIVYFNKVIEVEPKNKSAYLGLAEAYIGLNDTDSAIDILETALDVFSDDNVTLLEIYARLAEIDSGNYVWYIEPAQVYISLDNTDSAITVLEQGLENATRTEEIEELLSELLGETEEETEADEIEEVVEEVEDKPIFVTTRVDYYWNSDEYVNYWREYEYDSNYRVIKSTYYNCNDTVNGWYKYEYDSDGNLIKYTEYNSGIGAYYFDDELITYSDGEYLLWHEYEYNSNGNLIKDTEYNSDGSLKYLLEYVYEYDSNENLIKYHYEYYSDSSESISYYDIYEYEYDSNGNMIRSTKYNSAGTVISIVEHEYDSNGNTIQSITYDSDGSVSYWYEYECDTDGNRIKSSSCDSDGNVTSSTEYAYEYDSNGNLIKKTAYKPDSGYVSGYDEYEYSSNGSLIKVMYYEDGALIEWCDYSLSGVLLLDYCTYWYNGYDIEYEYDSDGTIIGRIITSYESEGNIDEIMYQSRIN